MEEKTKIAALSLSLSSSGTPSTMEERLRSEEKAAGCMVLERGKSISIGPRSVVGSVTKREGHCDIYCF
jgi:hypothetical protein